VDIFTQFGELILLALLTNSIINDTIDKIGGEDGWQEKAVGDRVRKDQQYRLFFSPEGGYFLKRERISR